MTSPQAALLALLWLAGAAEGGETNHPLPATITQYLTARDALAKARLGIQSSTFHGQRLTTTLTRDNERLAKLEEQATAAKKSLIKEYVPPEIVTALGRPKAVDDEVADLIAAQPDCAKADLKVLLASGYIASRELALHIRYDAAAKRLAMTPDQRHLAEMQERYSMAQYAEPEIRYRARALAIVSALAPTPALAAARNDGAYLLHAADVWAAKLSPEAWKAANLRLAGRPAPL